LGLRDRLDERQVRQATPSSEILRDLKRLQDDIGKRGLSYLEGGLILRVLYHFVEGRPSRILHQQDGVPFLGVPGGQHIETIAAKQYPGTKASKDWFCHSQVLNMSFATAIGQEPKKVQHYHRGIVLLGQEALEDVG